MAPVAFVGAGGTAHAADFDTLMREGIALRRAGDDGAALKRFQQAYELDKTPRAVAQIGLAEQALGRWASADKHLHLAIGARDDPWIRKNQSSIQEALSVVATHVGRLEISGTPAGAEVRVDGELVGALPLPGPITVTAGGVAIEVRGSGYVPIVRAATVGARMLTRESFTLQPLSPIAEHPAPHKTVARAASADSATAAATAAADSSSSSAAAEGTAAAESSATDSADGATSNGEASATGMASSRRMLVIGAAGLSVASLAFGIIEHLSWQHKVDSFGAPMSGCGATFNSRGAAGCAQLYDDGQRARTLAFVGYGLTGAFAATAVILYLTGVDSHSTAEPAKVACAPALGTTRIDCALRF